MNFNYEVISPCRGMIEMVMSQESAYVHEGETLFVIREKEQSIHVTAVINGHVSGIELQPGDYVIPGMILAHIQDDISMILIGSD